MTKLHAVDNQVIGVHSGGEVTIIARCDDAVRATMLLDRAWKLNDSRKYTASARMLAQAEQLPGFTWVQEVAAERGTR